MLEIFKFYVVTIKDMLERLWGGFQLTDNVNYLQFFVASWLVIVFISLLRFRVSSGGFEAFKQYSRDRKEGSSLGSSSDSNENDRTSKRYDLS